MASSEAASGERLMVMAGPPNIMLILKLRFIIGTLVFTPYNCPSRTCRCHWKSSLNFPNDVVIMEKSALTYKRHQPEETILYQVIADNVNTFFDMIASSNTGKPLPGFVRREFDKYLACGILSRGFVRVKCRECR